MLAHFLRFTLQNCDHSIHSSGCVFIGLAEMRADCAECRLRSRITGDKITVINLPDGLLSKQALQKKEKTCHDTFLPLGESPMRKQKVKRFKWRQAGVAML